MEDFSKKIDQIQQLLDLSIQQQDLVIQVFNDLIQEDFSNLSTEVLRRIQAIIQNFQTSSFELKNNANLIDKKVIAVSVLIKEALTENKKKANLSMEVLNSPQAILALELAIGKRLDGLSLKKEKKFFKLELNGKIYMDSLLNLANRIGANLTGQGSKYLIGRDYLILIRDGTTPAEAKLEVLKESLPLEELFVTPESVFVLESALNKKLENTNVSEEKTPFTLTLHGKKYSDSFKKLTERLGTKLSGKRHQRSLGRDYLILIRDGVIPEDAQREALKEKLPLEDVLITPETIAIFEQALQSRIEDLSVAQSVNFVTFVLNQKKYTDCFTNLTERLGFKLTGERSKRLIAKKYLILIKQGKSPQEAQRVLKN